MGTKHDMLWQYQGNLESNCIRKRTLITKVQRNTLQLFIRNETWHVVAIPGKEDKCSCDANITTKRNHDVLIVYLYFLSSYCLIPGCRNMKYVSCFNWNLIWSFFSVKECPFRASSRGPRWYLIREPRDQWRHMVCAAGTVFEKRRCTCVHQLRKKQVQLFS